MTIILNDMDARIYREELAPRLPRRILDAHAHVWSKDSFPVGFEFPDRDCYKRFGGDFTPELFRAIMTELLPEQEFGFVGFGAPHHDADRSKVPSPLHPGEFAEVLISPADSAETVAQRVEATGAVGVKPYWNYAAETYGKTSAQVEITDMITPEQFEYLNQAGLAITLHIPRPGRFSDTVNRRQMLDICQKYPNIRLIFAHIGLAYFMRGIREGNPGEFAQFPNAYFDTAMINHEGVLKYTFDTFPAERILFGSDSPIALLRGKSVEINDQYAYLMGEDYNIGTAIQDTAHAVQFTTFYYEQLRAVLNAAPKDAVEKVLYSNAMKLFSEIKQCKK